MNERLRDVLAEVLELAPVQVTPNLRRADTGAWDSLAHLRLITMLEAEFGASFTLDEIASVQTPADLERVIEVRGSAIGVT
jgi:acyl carrier protein